MLYISTKSWSVKNLSSKSVGEAVAWFHFEARLKYKLLRQLVDFHQSRTKCPWTYRNLSRRVYNIYILALCHKKMYISEVWDKTVNLFRLTAVGRWGKLGFFCFFWTMYSSCKFCSSFLPNFSYKYSLVRPNWQYFPIKGLWHRVSILRLHCTFNSHKLLPLWLFYL